MQTVIETATSKAIYLFNDAYPVTITDKGMTVPDFRALDIRPDTHSVVTNVPRPPTWAGNALQWDGTAWVTLDQAALDAAVEAAKTRRKAELASLRYTKEVGGTTIAGTPIATDRDSQVKWIAERIKAKEDPTYTVNWKTSSGFVSLDAPTIIALADGVHAHVKASFAREGALTADIGAATTVQAVAAIDITTGWPT